MPLLFGDSRIGAAASNDLTTRRIVVRIVAPVVLLAAVMAGLGLLLTHLLAHWWPLGTEDGVDRALAAHRDPALNSVTGALSTIANTIGTVVLAMVACLVAYRCSRHWREAAFIATSLAVEVGVFLLTTVLVHRPRPAGLELDHAPPTSSFPSGHSAAAVALYGAIAWLLVRRTGRRYAWLLLLLPVAVGFARLYRGMHHPSDVIAGFLLGACAVVIADHALPRPAPTRSPAPLTRSAAR